MQDGSTARLMRCIERDRAVFAACDARLVSSPDSPEAQSAYDAAALALAEDYEELCVLLVKSRRISDTYGEEIRAWVEDGPLKEKYRWRVPTYPATAEVWRLTRRTEGRSSGRRAA